MRVKVITELPSQRGIIPAGQIIEIPPALLEKLRGRVEALPAQQAYWRPEFKAWLENDELRTTGVCDDLAGEIIKLTADNLPLQAKLLRLHVGTYSTGRNWLETIRKWRERAKHLFETEGKGLHDANWQAAEEMRLLAFAAELRLMPAPFD